jgi:hypothetical protein
MRHTPVGVKKYMTSIAVKGRIVKEDTMFENEKVKHVKFGTGEVVECDGTHIKIMFDSQVEAKTFAYPDVFEKFVSFDNGQSQDTVQAALEQEKVNKKKIAAMKKLILQENERKRQEELAKKPRRRKSAV